MRRTICSAPSPTAISGFPTPPSCSYSCPASRSRSPTVRDSSTAGSSSPFAGSVAGCSTLYWVQIVISLTAAGFLIASVTVLDDDDLMDDNAREMMFGTPLRGLAAILGLTHHLPFFDILPLYIVLLAATPLLLTLARRDRWLMLGVSAAIYLAARAFGLNIPTWPVDGVWFFNPFAWQLVFAVGLAVGTGARGGVAKDARLLAASLVVVAVSAFLVTDGFSLLPGFWDSARDTLDISKTDLGMARLLHFLALAYAVYYCGLTRLVARTPLFKPLCVIGRHSLPVFAAGSLLSTVCQMIIDSWAPALPITMAMIATGIALHYLLARVLAMRAGRARQAAVAQVAYRPLRAMQA